MKDIFECYALELVESARCSSFYTLNEYVNFVIPSKMKELRDNCCIEISKNSLCEKCLKDMTFKAVAMWKNNSSIQEIEHALKEIIDHFMNRNH